MAGSVPAELLFALHEFARQRGITAGAEPDRDADERSQDELLARVRTACQIRERHREKLTLQVHSEPGAALRLIEVAYTNRRFSVRYGLGVTDRPIGPRLLAQFEAALAARYLGSSAAAPAQLVYAGPAPEAATITAAEQRLIEVLSLEEYESLLRLGPALLRQTGRLEQDPRYPAALYVPQRMQICRDASFRFSESSEQALDEVITWLRSPHSRFVLILGDFGTGKTFLLYELVRRLGRSPGPLIPLLCELRQIEKAQDLPMLLVQHMRQAGIEPIDPDALLHMLELGRIVLCFDGFDELALRTSFDRAAEHLETLLQAVRGQAKVVVTSRTQHFLNDQQIKTLLGQRLERAPCYVGRLLPFERPQILQFLRNRLGDEESAQKRYQLLDSVRDLLGLSHNPRMLGFIAQIAETKLLEAQLQHGAVSAAGLYQILVDDWLDFEIRRRSERVADRSLSKPELLDAVTRLALQLWRKTEATVGLAEIESAARGALEDIEVVIHQVGSASLLVRDPEGRFSFLHQSVLEWLVARAAAAEIQQGADSEVLGAHDLSELMAEFLVGLAGREAAARWATQALALAGEEGAAAARRDNAWLIFRRLGQVPPGRLKLAGQALRGRDFAAQDLRWADLSRSDLCEALLVGARLQDADLRGAALRGADLRRADLRRADLRQADLRRANLMGADLRGAKLEGALLAAARLLGARLHDGDGAGGPVLELPALECLHPQSAPRLALTPAAYSGQCLAWSPDGELLALGIDTGSVALLDNPSPSGTVLRTLPAHSGEVHAVAFSPDGRLLAAAYEDGTVRLWDVDRGESVRCLRGHGDTAFGVAFSPDGALVASASLDKTLRLWRVADGAEHAVLHGHEGAVFSVAFSRRGNLLASGSGDRTVRLWDARTGAERAVLRGHQQAAWSVSFSSDDTLLASGSWDRTVHVWRTDSGEQIRILAEHPASVVAVAWSPRKQQLAVGIADGALRLISLDDGARDRDKDTEGTALPQSAAGHQHAVLALAWSPDGTGLASASLDRTVRVFREERGALHPVAQLRSHIPPVYELAFSPDGGSLLCAAHNQVLCWQLPSVQLGDALTRCLGPVWSIAISPGGSCVAAGLPDHTIRLSVPGTNEFRILSGHQSTGTSLAFSPDGTMLASTAFDQTLRLWRVADGQLLHTLSGQGGQLHHVRWSSDGKLLLVAADGGTLLLFGVQDGLIHKYEAYASGHTGTVFCAVFSPDQNLIASGGEDGSVRLLRKQDRSSLRLDGHSAAVSDVVFSPDGQVLASSSRDRTVILWRVSDGQVLSVLRGHEDVVFSVRFHPDGQLLASASKDGTVRLWSAKEPRCLVTLLASERGWVGYLPDGRYKSGGEPGGLFWHVLGRCRFELGELADLLPGLRVAEGASLLELPPWTPRIAGASPPARPEPAALPPVRDPAPAPERPPSAMPPAREDRPETERKPALPARKRSWVWPGLAAAAMGAALLTAHRGSRDTEALRGLQPLPGPASSAAHVAPGRNLAVLFATTQYDDSRWPALKTPAPDALALESDLRALYGFEVERISNPRVEDIRSKIRRLAERSYGDGDQLLLMFSGHGDKDETLKKGWIIARDSRAGERQSAYPYSELREDIDNIPCRHILLVLDVCFGGSFDLSIKDTLTRARDYREASTEEFIRRKLRYRSRLYLSSVDQRTEAPEGQGHSPFTWRLLEALRNGGGEDGVLTWSELVGFLEKLDPEPRGGVFPKTTNNDPGGDFLFVRKRP